MPKFLKRALLLLTAFAVLSVSLCACAGSTSTSSSEAVSAVSGEPSTGGSVTVGISQDLDSLDPVCFRMCAYHFSQFDHFDFPEVYESARAEDVQAFLGRVVQRERSSLSVIEPVKEDVS